jgi:hypothetical protein
MKSCKVTFTRNDGASVEIELFNHYTCILGDSGAGKTEFIAMIEDGLADDTITIESELPVDIASTGSLAGLLEISERRIIIVDELAMMKEELLSKINTSKHLFVGFSRAMPLRLECSPDSIYRLKRKGNWFVVESAKNSAPFPTK